MYSAPDDEMRGSSAENHGTACCTGNLESWMTQINVLHEGLFSDEILVRDLLFIDGETLLCAVQYGEHWTTCMKVVR